jgi:hypothetical protein
VSEQTTVPSFEELEETLEKFLEGLEPSKRLERIADLTHRLEFHRRFTELTPAEVEHMTNPLSLATRVQLDAAKDDAARERLIQAHARAFYFRECAWRAYLNGETKEKPFDSKRQKQKVA